MTELFPVRFNELVCEIFEGIVEVIEDMQAVINALLRLRWEICTLVLCCHLVLIERTAT